MVILNELFKGYYNSSARHFARGASALAGAYLGRRLADNEVEYKFGEDRREYDKRLRRAKLIGTLTGAAAGYGAARYVEHKDIAKKTRDYINKRNLNMKQKYDKMVSENPDLKKNPKLVPKYIDPDNISKRKESIIHNKVKQRDLRTGHMLKKQNLTDRIKNWWNKNDKYDETRCSMDDWKG